MKGRREDSNALNPVSRLMTLRIVTDSSLLDWSPAPQFLGIPGIRVGDAVARFSMRSDGFLSGLSKERVQSKTGVCNHLYPRSANDPERTAASWKFGRVGWP